VCVPERLIPHIRELTILLDSIRVGTRTRATIRVGIRGCLPRDDSERAPVGRGPRFTGTRRRRRAAFCISSASASPLLLKWQRGLCRRGSLVSRPQHLHLHDSSCSAVLQLFRGIEAGGAVGGSGSSVLPCRSQHVLAVTSDG
jgi:hypothetical protein